ncbi:MAG: protein kinase [Polyangiaceae bacterium]
MAERIGGRYEVLGALGAGTEGQVFRCQDLVLGGEVALKLLVERGGAGAHTLHLEFEQLRLCRHPNLVDVRDFGFDRHRGRAFYTSTVLEGLSLRAFAQGRAFREVERALGHALAALAHLHRIGFLHGDLKPENVLVTHAGDGTLLDLGASVRLGAGELPRLGTPGYLAPELTAGKADERSDLFAFGKVLEEIAPTMNGVPRSLAGLVRRLTSADPLSRPATADEVATLLKVDLERTCRSFPRGMCRSARALYSSRASPLEEKCGSPEGSSGMASGRPGHRCSRHAGRPLCERRWREAQLLVGEASRARAGRLPRSDIGDLCGGARRPLRQAASRRRVRRTAGPRQV